MGRKSQVRTFMLNFTVIALKIWACSPKIAEIGNFWYKFIPLSDFFFKFGVGEEDTGLHPHAKFHRFGLKIRALYSLQN